MTGFLAAFTLTAAMLTQQFNVPGTVSGYESCTRQLEGRYDWQITAGPGWLTLSSDDIPGFITHVTAEGVDTQGRFQLSLSTDGGLRQVRIVPPLIGFYGVPVSWVERQQIELYIQAGREYLRAGDTGAGYYTLDGAAIGMLEAGPYAGLNNDLTLLLVSGETVLVSGKITTFLLEEGLAQWDEQTAILRDEGCLRR